MDLDVLESGVNSFVNRQKWLGIFAAAAFYSDYLQGGGEKNKKVMSIVKKKDLLRFPWKGAKFVLSWEIFSSLRVACKWTKVELDLWEWLSLVVSEKQKY